MIKSSYLTTSIMSDNLNYDDPTGDSYDSFQIIQTFAYNPDNISIVDPTVIGPSDLLSIQDAIELLEETFDFDFYALDDYLQHLSANAEVGLPNPGYESLEALAEKGFIPDQIPAINEILRNIYFKYAGQVKVREDETNNQPNEIKAVFIFALDLIHDALYNISEEALTANEFEGNRPPCLHTLKSRLIQIENLLSSTFNNKHPHIAIEYAVHEMGQVYSSIDRNSTRIPGDPDYEKKQKRRSTIETYTAYVEGYKRIMQHFVKE